MRIKIACCIKKTDVYYESTLIIGCFLQKKSIHSIMQKSFEVCIFCASWCSSWLVFPFRYILPGHITFYFINHVWLQYLIQLKLLPSLSLGKFIRIFCYCSYIFISCSYYFSFFTSWKFVTTVFQGTWKNCYWLYFWVDSALITVIECLIKWEHQILNDINTNFSKCIVST